MLNKKQLLCLGKALSETCLRLKSNALGDKVLAPKREYTSLPIPDVFFPNVNQKIKYEEKEINLEESYEQDFILWAKKKYRVSTKICLLKEEGGVVVQKVDLEIKIKNHKQLVESIDYTTHRREYLDDEAGWTTTTWSALSDHSQNICDCLGELPSPRLRALFYILEMKGHSRMSVASQYLIEKYGFFKDELKLSTNKYSGLTCRLPKRDELGSVDSQFLPPTIANIFPSVFPIIVGENIPVGFPKNACSVYSIDAGLGLDKTADAETNPINGKILLLVKGSRINLQLPFVLSNKNEENRWSNKDWMYYEINPLVNPKRCSDVLHTLFRYVVNNRVNHEWDDDG